MQFSISFWSDILPAFIFFIVDLDVKKALILWVVQTCGLKRDLGKYFFSKKILRIFNITLLKTTK